MTPIKKRWILVPIALVAVALLAMSQDSVTSQCCQSSLERLFAPQEETPITTNYVSQAVPVVVQRYTPPVQPVTVSPAPTVVNYAPSSSCCNINPEPVVACPVAEPVTTTVTKVVPETQMREEEVTTYETVCQEEVRYRTKTVSRQVPETSVKKETVVVNRPVWDTVEKETSYDIIKYVPETSEREEVQKITRPVTKMEERQIVQKVQKPVQTTVMKQRSYTVNREVVSCRTQVQDVGSYVTNYSTVPGKTYNRLTWFPGGDYYNPATGITRYRLPGFYWTEMTAAPQYKTNRIWQPKLVETKVPVTTLVPETITENYPVIETSFQEEEIVRTEQVPVTVMEEQQIVKKIPVTSYKQVTERVVQKTPVKVCRMEQQEHVREIPVTTYKVVNEVIQEPYTVKVMKTIPKTTKVLRPYTVYKTITETIGPAKTTSSTQPVNKTEPTPADRPATGTASTIAPAVPVPANSAAATPSLNSEKSQTVERPIQTLPGPDEKKISPVLKTEESEDQQPVEKAVAPKQEAAVRQTPAVSSPFLTDSVFPMPNSLANPANLAPTLSHNSPADSSAKETAVADQSALQQVTAGKPIADQPAVEKATTEKTADTQPAAEKTTTDKEAGKINITAYKPSQNDNVKKMNSTVSPVSTTVTSKTGETKEIQLIPNANINSSSSISQSNYTKIQGKSEPILPVTKETNIDSSATAMPRNSNSAFGFEKATDQSTISTSSVPLPNIAPTQIFAND